MKTTPFQLLWMCQCLLLLWSRGGRAESWNVTGSMHERRAGHTLTLLADGTVLAASGHCDDYPFHNTSEIYDPASGRWTLTGSLHIARTGHSATLLSNGQVLVASGRVDPNRDADTSATTTAEIYDPATRSWSFVGDLHDPRTYHTSTLLPDGRVLVTGGEYYDYANDHETVTLVSTEIFDPATGQWSQAADLHQRQADHTATLLEDGTVLVAGTGVGEVFDAATGVWREVRGPMLLRRSEHTATLLLDGRVMMAGGNGLPLSELYDPTMDLFVPADPLWNARVFHTATLLPEGYVLVVGGTYNLAQATAEYYQPDYDRWIIVESMHKERSGHSATILPNGNVLVCGGADRDRVVATAEVFINDLKSDSE